MKKLLSLLLVFSVILVSGGICFAAPGDTAIPDSEVPGAPLENVDAATYEEPPVEIEDEGIPEGLPDTFAEVTEIEEEEIPRDLPKTGGIPAEAFYAVGGLFVIAALVLSRKKANI
ncbi:MAG: LPXTG cell wall anchor domain-containing protein [Acetivibrionales bacterium]|jgi:LPXTG-motif cell wall-anchored protein